MRRISRALLAIAVPGTMIATMVGGVFGPVPAHAYGTDHVYQLTFSLNCDKMTSPMCAPDVFGLGGVWGWIEPDSDGTADATVTDCAHRQIFGTGAFHENLDEVPWSITSSLDGQFALGTDPNGNYIVFDSPDIGFLAFPATPGHYTVTFGPGVRAEGTVALMH